jgi:hypothetical protein
MSYFDIYLNHQINLTIFEIAFERSNGIPSNIYVSSDDTLDGRNFWIFEAFKADNVMIFFRIAFPEGSQYYLVSISDFKRRLHHSLWLRDVLYLYIESVIERISVLIDNIYNARIWIHGVSFLSESVVICHFKNDVSWGIWNDSPSSYHKDLTSFRLVINSNDVRKSARCWNKSTLILQNFRFDLLFTRFSGLFVS